MRRSSGPSAVGSSGPENEFMSRRFIAVAGLIAQVVFVLSWLAAATWQGPRYSSVQQTISDMYAVTAPYGEFLVIVLSLCGAATILFALIALRPALGGGWRATTGAVLLALSIYGLGDLLSAFEREGCRLADQGCTSADQMRAGGATDALLSTVGLACFVAARIFPRRRHEAGSHLAEMGLADPMGHDRGPGIALGDRLLGPARHGRSARAPAGGHRCRRHRGVGYRCPPT